VTTIGIIHSPHSHRGCALVISPPVSITALDVSQAASRRHGIAYNPGRTGQWFQDGEGER
jgi:hypothetical protein